MSTTTQIVLQCLMDLWLMVALAGILTMALQAYLESKK